MRRSDKVASQLTTNQRFAKLKKQNHLIKYRSECLKTMVVVDCESSELCISGRQEIKAAGGGGEGEGGGRKEGEKQSLTFIILGKYSDSTHAPYVFEASLQVHKKDNLRSPNLEISNFIES